MQIRLLALDLDGTIVANLATISERIQTVIQAAMDKGVNVTLATGREYKISAKFARQLNINAPIICYQGGLVQDHRTDQTLLAHFVPADLSRQVIKFARANKLPMLLYTPQMPLAELPSALMREIFEQARSPFELVNNLLGALDEDQLPLKFLFVQPEAESERVCSLLEGEFGEVLTLTRSLETLVEATLPNVSKGAALQHLAERLNIPLTQTMAIGDQDNDVTMIKTACLGVAMGNASARAKAVADVVAPPLTEDGAAWAIEKYILDRGNDSNS
jgi:Cof subfamily protein (haloacid dehalogenase superfamily)